MKAQAYPGAATVSRRSRLGFRYLGGAICALFSTLAVAQIDVADVPLVLGRTLEPNLLYIHDDSGSMLRNFMPDGRVDGSDTRKKFRSHSWNTVFYDPAVAYRAPVNHLGESLGDASFTAAWSNGYAKTGSVNLSSSFTGYATYNATVEYRGSATSGWQVVDTPQYSTVTGVSVASGTCTTANRRIVGGVFEINAGSSTCRTARFTVSGTMRAHYYLYDESEPYCTGATEEVRRESENCYRAYAVSTEERTNFANWYSYYRTRDFSARAGISLAFSQLGSGIRVGYGRINNGSVIDQDGKNVSTIIRGVRAFGGEDRRSFFDWLLYNSGPVSASSPTPLRRALDAAGQYYENDDDRGPWSTTPGVAGGNHLACRRSYTLLMTDGYWNDAQASTAAARGNVDNSTWPTIHGYVNDNPTSYTYTPRSPFMDGQSNLLADVAMYYWVRDLSNLPNRVPTTPRNPAFWQHMVTFTVGLGLASSGSVELVDPEAAFNAIATGDTINWPTVTGNTQSTLNDLVHAAVNGRGGTYSANNPDQFASALRSILSAIVDENASVSALAQSSTRAASSTMLFAGSFDSEDWTGKLEAIPYNPVTGFLSARVAWEASDRLASVSPASRRIFTWNPVTEAGTDFFWGSLTDDQKAHLNDDERLLAYLRGDRTYEGGDFRMRSSLLGDIVNSSPLFVGTQRYIYGTAPGMTGGERSAYTSRQNSAAYKERRKMVYVGANDGMLHAFDAETGDERFAFVPNAVFEHLPLLADPEYKNRHRYYVDGSPSVGDAYVSGAWRTVLVGSTGAGGRSYFALNVENPDAITASNKVMWEFTHPELGLTVGQASVVKTESGHWVAIFGNGYNSHSHRAQLFVVDLATGDLLKAIDTGVGSLASPNGLAAPVTVDYDRNGLVDLVYAGDFQGNVWKFDFTGTSVAHWRVAYEDSGEPRPLFRAVGPSSARQAVTAKPQVNFHPDKGLMVYVGTGKFLLNGDQGDTSVQSFYGIHDQCGRKVESAGCYSIGSRPAAVYRDELRQQRIYYEAGEAFSNSASLITYDEGVRLVTRNALESGDKGFYLDLISPVNGNEGERIIGQPSVAFNGRVDFATVIPNEDPCSSGTKSWYMSIDPLSGGRLTFTVFDLNRDKSFDHGEYITDPATGELVPVSGRYLGPGTGFATTVHGDEIASVLGLKRDTDPRCDPGSPTYDAAFAANPANCAIDVATKGDPSRWGRQSWRQLQ